MVVALVLVATSCYKTFDFNNDNKADLIWADGGTGDWHTVDSAGVSSLLLNATGIPMVGDYDGDGKFEVATLSGNTWAAHGATPVSITFAQPTGAHDRILPVPGMYDGNHKTLPAYFRDTDATWFIYGHDPIQFGSGPTNPAGTLTQKQDQDFPIPADYDGDGVTDLATYSPATAMWHVLRSSDHVLWETSYEAQIGVPVPGRYNGGKADVGAIYTFDGRWIIDGHPVPTAYGSTDQSTFPTPADYDGDGSAEPAYVTIKTGPGVSQWHISTLTDPISITASSGAGAFPAELNWNLPLQWARLAAVARCTVTVPAPSGC